jgi:hypothetical protein
MGTAGPPTSVRADRQRLHANVENGVEAVNTAIPMGYNQTNGPYFKFGAYRYLWDTTTIIEYANVIACDDSAGVAVNADPVAA